MQRALSAYENLFRARTQFQLFNNFQVSGLYSVDLTEEIVSKVVRKIILNNPILGCNCFKENGIWIMRPVNKIKTSDVFIHEKPVAPKSKDSAWITEDTMKAFNGMKFKVNLEAQLFKIQINGKVLSVVFDHSLFDGMVGLYFHKEFDKYLPEIYNESRDPDFNDDFVIYEKGDKFVGTLPPAVDDHLTWKTDYTNGEPYFDKEVPTFDKSSSKQLDRFPGRLKAIRDIPISFKLISFTPEQLQQIVKACKQNGVTVTSYLEVVFALTFRPLFGETYTINKVAMALRRHFSAADDYLWGCSPHTGIVQNLPPIDEFSWSIVQLVNTNLKKAANNKYVLHTMSFWFEFHEQLEETDEIKDPVEEQFFENTLGKQKGETIKLSNIGILKSVNPAGAPQVKDLVFAQDLSPTSGDFIMNVVTVEGMTIVVSYFDLEEDFTDLVEQFKLNVLKFAN